MVLVSNGHVSVSDDEVLVLFSVSDDEAETLSLVCKHTRHWTYDCKANILLSVETQNGVTLNDIYFVSARERPSRQRVVQNNTLVIALAASVSSHAFKKESQV